MCGIVGHVGPGLSADESNALIGRQLNLIRHRGPDGNGIYFGEQFAFGHARLSIIDLESGSQPMMYADGNLTVTFNGEIYNYVELREELEKVGFRFKTKSDTEVLLASYHRWGEDMVKRLNGMFAFAIYDKRDQVLFCARDPLGQKPFYYTHVNGVLHFSSESRAFNVIPGFAGDVDPVSMAHYLTFESLYFDRSILANVKKLPPGHRMRFKKGTIKIDSYFESVPHEGTVPDNPEEFIHDKMKEAVRIAFRADVPVGLLLSGGLDSTIVLALLRHNYPSAKISTFTIRNEDKTYDESHYAKQAADLFGTNHTMFNMKFETLRDLASSLPGQFDEPQADPGVLPKYFICKEVSKHMKVALTGDGGDEFFYGYLIFKAQRLASFYRWMPGPLHQFFIHPMIKSIPTKIGYMQKDFLLKQFAKGFPAREAHRNYKWTCAFDESQLANLFTPELARSVQIDFGLKFLEELDQKAMESGQVGRLAYKYQRTYLPDYVLVNSDRASMLNSVELRSPLLDVELVRALNALPDSLKMPGFRTKGFMKKIAQRYLPQDLIERRKVGFTVPIADLIRRDLRPELEELFSTAQLRKQAIFNPEFVHSMLQRHFDGKANLYKQIWTLYTLQKWLLERKSR
jgi:asparagine synthase (glutamine-hydrolysing)